MFYEDEDPDYSGGPSYEAEADFLWQEEQAWYSSQECQEVEGGGYAMPYDDSCEGGFFYGEEAQQ